jgi:hypothetical protein
MLVIEDNLTDLRLTVEALKDSEMSNQRSVVRDGVEATAYLLWFVRVG